MRLTGGEERGTGMGSLGGGTGRYRGTPGLGHRDQGRAPGWGRGPLGGTLRPGPGLGRCPRPLPAPQHRREHPAAGGAPRRHLLLPPAPRPRLLRQVSQGPRLGTGGIRPLPATPSAPRVSLSPQREAAEGGGQHPAGQPGGAGHLLRQIHQNAEVSAQRHGAGFPRALRQGKGALPPRPPPTPQHPPPVLSAVPLSQYKVWVKPGSEQSFLYGNHVLKSGLGRITENTAQYQGVVVYSMADVPLVSPAPPAARHESQAAETSLFSLFFFFPRGLG